MLAISSQIKKLVLILLLIILLTTVIVFPFKLPPESGDIDFRPYWSSTYLLRQGDDFSNPEKMDAIERNLTGWDLPFTMIAWFAPTGNLILWPYTYLSFSRASFYWLITNIIALFMSAVLIWPASNKKIWIPLVTVFGFSQTLISLKYGQINTIVLLGLVLFLTLFKNKHAFLAGASLILTTVKPHLVILTLPLLLLALLRRKQWLVIAGFISALTVSALLLFVLNPEWPLRFWHLISFGMSSIRLTPTLNGLLVLSGQYFWGKWLWIGFLIGSILLWWVYGKDWKINNLISISLILGLIISPIGWSYDQIVLLFPILLILTWIAEGYFSKVGMNLIIFSMLLINGFSFYQRAFSGDDVWFFWLPMVTGILYGYAWLRGFNKHTPAPLQEIP